MLIGLIKLVAFTSDIDKDFLNNFLRHFDFPNNFFNHLLYSSFLFLRPVGSKELLDKVIFILGKLRTDIVIDAAFGLEGLNHFPLPRLDLEHVDDRVHLLESVCAAAKESGLLCNCYLLLD